MTRFNLIFLVLISFLIINDAKEIKFCSIGMGTYGILTAKLAIQKGFKMVSAFTRYSKHTKVVGDLLGMSDDESLSFMVSDMNKFEQIIDETKPDFCIDATNNTLESVYPHFIRAINKKINILTLVSETVYPDTRFDWKTNQLSKSLDSLCKKYGVVIVGGGLSDSIIIPVVPSIAASMQSLSKITMTLIFRGDDLGEKYGVGLTEKEFKEKLGSNKLLFANWQRRVIESIAENVNNPLLELVDDHHHKTLQLYSRTECLMVDNEHGVQSKALNKVIPFGDCKGMNVTVLGRAENNVEITFSALIGVGISKDDKPNDFECKFHGNPDIEFAIKDVNGFTTTALSVIHRIPMVLNELEPGLYNTGRLPPNKYWNKVSDWNHETEEDENKNDEQQEKTDDETDKSYKATDDKLDL